MNERPSPTNVESLRDRLTREQVTHADAMPITYRIYTEDKVGLVQLISRYFAGASIIDAIGVWQGGTELARIIEIVGTRTDLQRVCDLAGDIKVANQQSSVLVTWAPCARLDV